MIKLINIGNTCYLNSALQCLLNSEIFINNLKEINNPEFNKLSDLLLDLYKNDNKNPYELKKFLSGYNNLFKGAHQQDAHECILAIIDVVHNLAKISPKKGKYYETSFNRLPKEQISKARDQHLTHLKTFGHSFIDDIYSGQFASTIKCSECSYNNNSFEIFTDITLNIPEEIPNPDVFDCFIDYLKDIEIEVFCDNCRKNTKMRKKLSIWKFPKILIVTLSRFSNIKNNKEVHINPNLKFFIQKNKQGITYSLKTSVHHNGHSPNYGHYTTMLLKNNNCYIIDDDRVYKVDNFNSINSSSVYILIYEDLSIGSS